MICRTDGEVWLVEAKRELNTSAIGQILSYKESYEKTYEPANEIHMVIVCAKADELLEETCKHQGIEMLCFDGVFLFVPRGFAVALPAEVDIDRLEKELYSSLSEPEVKDYDVLLAGKLLGVN